MSKSLAAMALGGLALLSTESMANPLKSLYTTIDLKKDCRVTRKHEHGNRWSCKGLSDWPVYVAEGDLRFFVSVGPGAEKRRAGTQTLSAFNSIFKGNSNRATLEWRIEMKAGKSIPHATILRYYIDMDGKRGQRLVVMKVTAKETCHVAHLDAAAPDALVAARAIADGEARSFDCKNEPREVASATGKRAP